MVRSRGSRCFLKTEKLLCLGFGKRLFFLWEHFPIDDLCATKNTEDDTRSRICSLFRSGLDDHLARWFSSPWGRAWHRPETSTTAIKEGWDNDPVVLKFWGGCGGSSKSNPFSQLPFQCGFPPGFPVSTLYTFVNNNKQRKKTVSITMSNDQYDVATEVYFLRIKRIQPLFSISMWFSSGVSRFPQLHTLANNNFR